MRTLWTLERSGLRQVADFVLEVFVGQVEDHGLLADLLLAHQAVLHAGGCRPPAGAALTRPATVTSPAGVTARHVSHVVSLGARTHHGVVELDDLPVGHSVVDGQIVTHFGFVRTAIHWTLEWGALEHYRNENFLSLETINSLPT